MGVNMRSANVTLAERTPPLVILVKRDGTNTRAATVGFSNQLNEVPRALRLSMTYEQGREMVKLAKIMQRAGTAIYFADPHSPWQYGSSTDSLGRCVHAVLSLASS